VIFRKGTPQARLDRAVTRMIQRDLCQPFAGLDVLSVSIVGHGDEVEVRIETRNGPNYSYTRRNRRRGMPGGQAQVHDVSQAAAMP